MTTHKSEDYKLSAVNYSRWVLKKPLFDKFFTKGRKEDTDDEGELCDVGY